MIFLNRQMVFALALDVNPAPYLFLIPDQYHMPCSATSFVPRATESEQTAFECFLAVEDPLLIQFPAVLKRAEDRQC
jgi:hypothetical protein